MDREGFRRYLLERKLTEKQMEESIAVVERFETFLRTRKPPHDLSSATRKDVNAFSAVLIEEDANTWETYLTIARGGRFAGNYQVFATALEYIDGHEALGNLFTKLSGELGTDERDRIFRGIALPPLGTPNTEKHRAMRVAVERLEKRVGPKRCAEILGTGLRDLPDEGFAGEKSNYEAAGGIDAYLAQKGDAFIAELEKIRDKKGLYFNQPITNEVIAFVQAHPEIRQGLRIGNVIYEAKIPYMAVEFLAEADPKKKAYLYCHCPWARESLRNGETQVPATFCNCSAAFHKKPYDVIFGKPLRAEVIETVLNGDPWCKFAIYLPDDVT
ncbi:MAG: hypothetical protein ABFD77_04975 [Thermotogota bacterium]